MTSNQYEIPEAQSIPYAINETHKRSFGQFVVKVKNTILLQLAYSAPHNYLRVLFNKWRGVHVGKHVNIGQHCFLDNLHPELIFIEDNATINAGTMILTHFNPREEFIGVFLARMRPVLIKKGAMVSVNSTIMPGVTIGEWACVSSGCVVDKDVPPYTIASGNPMQLGANYQKLFERAQRKRQERGI